MEELSLHIEYLLLRHDCVIVPGFGAFIANRRGARIDHTTSVIHPPTREVGFNRSIDSPDGLLAHSIARRGGMSFEEGRELMQKGIEEIRERLLTEGEVTLGHVGTLILGDESTLEFHPYRRGEATALSLGRGVEKMSMGMEVQSPTHEIYSSRVANEPSTNCTGSEATQFKGKTADTKEKNEVSDQLYSGKDSLEANEASGRAIPDKAHGTNLTSSPVAATSEQSGYYTIRIRKTYAHIAASILLIIFATLSLILPPSNRLEGQAYASVVPMGQLDNSAEKSVSDKERGETDATEGSTSQAPTSNLQQNKSDESETLLPYYLIVATFRTREEAESFIAGMNEDQRLYCVEGKRLCRVAIASSAYRNELQDQLNDKEFSSRYPGAWIWRSK